jgi:hypothetical protein
MSETLKAIKELANVDLTTITVSDISKLANLAVGDLSKDLLPYSQNILEYNAVSFKMNVFVKGYQALSETNKELFRKATGLHTGAEVSAWADKGNADSNSLRGSLAEQQRKVAELEKALLASQADAERARSDAASRDKDWQAHSDSVVQALNDERNLNLVLTNENSDLKNRLKNQSQTDAPVPITPPVIPASTNDYPGPVPAPIPPKGMDRPDKDISNVVVPPPVPQPVRPAPTPSVPNNQANNQVIPVVSPADPKPAPTPVAPSIIKPAATDELSTSQKVELLYGYTYPKLVFAFAGTPSPTLELLKAIDQELVRLNGNIPRKGDLRSIYGITKYTSGPKDKYTVYTGNYTFSQDLYTKSTTSALYGTLVNTIKRS